MKVRLIDDLRRNVVNILFYFGDMKKKTQLFGTMTIFMHLSCTIQIISLISPKMVPIATKSVFLRGALLYY